MKVAADAMSSDDEEFAFSEDEEESDSTNNDSVDHYESLVSVW